MDVVYFILNILGLEQLYFFQFRGHQLSFSLIASYRGNTIILISCVIIKGPVRIQNFFLGVVHLSEERRNWWRKQILKANTKAFDSAIT